MIAFDVSCSLFASTNNVSVYRYIIPTLSVTMAALRYRASLLLNKKSYLKEFRRLAHRIVGEFFLLLKRRFLPVEYLSVGKEREELSRVRIKTRSECTEPETLWSMLFIFQTIRFLADWGWIPKGCEVISSVEQELYSSVSSVLLEATQATTSTCGNRPCFTLPFWRTICISIRLWIVHRMWSWSVCTLWYHFYERQFKLLRMHRRLWTFPNLRWIITSLLAIVHQRTCTGWLA